VEFFWSLVFSFLGAANGRHLVVLDKIKLIFYLSLILGGGNVLLNIFMIPRYGFLGAAYATLLAQLIAFFANGIFLCARKGLTSQLYSFTLLPLWNWRCLRRGEEGGKLLY